MYHWRLSSFYFFYFGSLGALAPYWTLYLDHLNFSAAAIGELIACMSLTRIISPNVWGWIADHTGRRVTIVRIGTALAAVGFAGTLFGTSYGWLAAVMMVFSFFWHAALPQFEAMTLNHLGEHVSRYSHIRLWGSIGFIVAVVSLGPLLDRFGVTLLPPVIVALMIGIWLASMVAPPDHARPPDRPHAPLREVLRRADVRALLVVCVLMQASHGPYYTFYSLYLEEYGYSRSEIGQLWALGVVAEIVVFLGLHRVSQRWRLRDLLWVSLALAALRWVLIGLFPNYVAVLMLAQGLHAASFGVYHAVAIQLVHRYFVGRNQGRGQALYSSLGFGAGGAIGSLYAGYLWQGAGATATFIVAGGLSLTAMLIALRWLRDPPTPEI